MDGPQTYMSVMLAPKLIEYVIPVLKLCLGLIFIQMDLNPCQRANEDWIA